jgi:2-isopropylmalate synthase
VKKVFLYDTTLRDGAQAEGVSYSQQDKINIINRLDAFGIHYIEGGWPYANQKTIDFFEYVRKNPLKHAKLAAFGSTCYADTSAAKDANIQGLLKVETEVVTIFGKSWTLHVKDVLRTTLDENLRMIGDSVQYLKKKERTVFYDAEHFFDGYRADSAYALKTLEAACEAGADCIVLCDTNGGTLPSELSRIVAEVGARISVPLGIHAHNDAGLAVANSLAAVEAGCVHVQGTINGIGERCGNADLVQIVPNLQLKMGCKVVSDKHLTELTDLSHFVSEVSNLKHHDNHPFVGKSAFAHKAGVHINAMVKNQTSYEHIDPELLGNKRRMLLSELSGKTSIVEAAKGLNHSIDKKSEQAQRLHDIILERERQGYHFEAAEASFKLIIERELKQHKGFFETLGFRAIIMKRDGGDMISEAMIKIRVGDEIQHTVAEGDGPVNALDTALRKALVGFYPELATMHLSDFKVRVLDEKEGTAAKVRVLIESQDADDVWTTIGVSENIIEASWNALVDSIEYKLMKARRGH